jgi:hypothetical protein
LKKEIVTLPKDSLSEDPKLYEALFGEDIKTSCYENNDGVTEIPDEVESWTKLLIEGGLFTPPDIRGHGTSESDCPGAYDFTPGADDSCLDFDLEDDINDENEYKYVPSYLKSKKYSDGFPGYTTFCNTRWHDNFKDVKKRPKHLHCRCATCAELQADLIRACQTGQNRDIYEKKAHEHYAEVRRWRTFEETVYASSVHNLGSEIVLSYDDTQAVGLPRFTNRDIKNLTNIKMRVIPFNLQNHGLHENYYFYTVYNMYSKGGNRLCSLLYHYLRRLKYMEPPQGETLNVYGQRKARKLTLIGDNYGENKNNILFAFCSELVMRRWFDVIYLFYGPVGHTHNGNDAVHYIHNQIAGNQNSVTLAEFFHAFRVAWKTDRTRPQPVILDVVYDWENYYEGYSESISCFQRSKTQETYCRGFKFEKNTSGVVEMRVKGSPNDPKWYGQDANSLAPGFVVLKTLPMKAPRIIEPSNSALEHAHLAALNSKSVQKVCQTIGKLDSHQWLVEFAKTGRIPLLGPPPSDMKLTDPKMMGWDFLEQFGVADRTICIPFMRHNPNHKSLKDWWGLPGDVEFFETPSLPVVPGVTCPKVRYTSDVSSKRKNQPSGATKSKVKQSKVILESSESEPESEDSQADWVDLDEPEQITNWGANFDLCVPGCYAIVHVQYPEDEETGSAHQGITVVQVFSCVFVTFHNFFKVLVPYHGTRTFIYLCLHTV